jgi:pyruvate,water dikinase
MWRVKRPAWCLVNGYYFARAEPRKLDLLLLPLRFLWSQLGRCWTVDWRECALPRFLRRIESAAAEDLSTQSNAEILAQLEAIAGDAGECWYAIGLASGNAVPLRRFLGKLLPDRRAEGELLQLIRGLATTTLEAHGKLFEFARKSHSGSAGSPSSEGQIAEARLAALEALGHQVGSLDLMQPSLGESPDAFDRAVQHYASRSAIDPRRAIARTRHERLRALETARSELEGRKLRLFDRLLERLAGHEIVLERTSFEFQRAWPQMRRRLIELVEVDDVFHLDWPNLVAAVLAKRSPQALHAEVYANRDRLNHQNALVPPQCIPPTGDPDWQNAPVWPINLRALGCAQIGQRWTLSGIAASPGRRSGIARICRSPSEASRLKPGDILVVARTTPDWTSLFATAGALVADFGAATSHSAVVAREFGIPAVVGTQCATLTIRDGDRITVDGSRGLVEIEEHVELPRASL